VALGNDMFGLLKNGTLKLLGEICYSTYLLHGIILFTILHFVLGQDHVKQFSPNKYCLLIFFITPIVVMVSFYAYKFIEFPFMHKAKLKIDKEKASISTL
jgi:peptidoglycan/LPS O-acetylase OafA/YrhL